MTADEATAATLQAEEYGVQQGQGGDEGHEGNQEEEEQRSRSDEELEEQVREGRGPSISCLTCPCLYSLRRLRMPQHDATFCLCWHAVAACKWILPCCVPSFPT
jgi:hypothetical protein